MDLNPMKKVKLTNSPVPGPPRSVDKSCPGRKLIAKLDHDCLVKVLMFVPLDKRLQMEEGKNIYLFISCTLYLKLN